MRGKKVSAPKAQLPLDYCKSKLGYIIKGATAMNYEGVSRSGHSETAVINFSPKKKTFFVKQYFFSESEHSPLYAAVHNPKLLYFQEMRNTGRIYNQVGCDLVPKIESSDDDNLILFFEYVDTPADGQHYLEARKKKDAGEKLRLIYEGAKKIARFDARLNLQPDLFKKDLQEQRHTLDTKTARLTDYLLKILEHQYRSQGKDVPADAESQKEFFRAETGLNFWERIRDLVSLGQVLGEEFLLQHGDCRVQHVLGKKFVDLEQFGLHEYGYDLVTYLSAEGGIAMPPITELSSVLGIYLAYQQANTEGNKRERKRKVTNLDGLGTTDVLKRIPSYNHTRFTARFLALDILESLHLDSSNKRYAPEHRQQFINAIPGYTLEDMNRARLDHIKDIFTLVSEHSLMWNQLEDSAKVKEYFNSFAELLQRLSLVDVEAPVLEKMRK